MRILAICGSPHGRKSITRRLVEQVLEGARSAGADVELVDLSETKVTYCTACNACHISGRCPVRDDFEPVRQKMLACDGLVLGSPNYFNTVSAQMKSVMDRLSSEIHCQEFLGKYGCCVATAGGNETDIVNEYMSDVLVRLGCSAVGSVGGTMSVAGSMQKSELDAIALGKDLVKAIEEKRAYPEQDGIHADMLERFKMLISFNKDAWPHEYENMRAKGWL